MYQSPTYASQGSKTVFVEIAQRRAETARLLQEARVAQPERLPKQTRSLTRRAVSHLDHLLEALGDWMTQLRVEARG